MKDHQAVALRRRVDRERKTAGQNRVRFSAGLKKEVLALASTPGWSRERVCDALGLASSVVYRWHVEANPQRKSKLKPKGGVMTRVDIVGSEAAPAPELSLVFPSGVQVKGLSLEQLGRLLGVKR